MRFSFALAALMAPSLAVCQSRLPVDHVILAIDSLERGIQLLRAATGVTAISGGVHPGRGTRNALIGLGAGRYLELMAPNPDDTTAAARATASARAAWFARFHTLTPVAWAIRAENVDAERRRLQSRGVPVPALQSGSRRRPDGRELSWSWFYPWGIGGGNLPFVIAWSPASPHPSADAPTGCVLVELRLVSPTPEPLRKQFADAGWPVAVVASRDDGVQLELRCPRGRVFFPRR